MKSRKLNLGCGRKIREGWINLDSVNLDGVDVVHNIEQLPLPFEDDYFEVIRCENILEHVEYIPILKDLHRILKPGTPLKIRVPHFTSRNNYVDPTHKKRFSVSTFDFFVKGCNENYYFDFGFSEINEKQIRFLKKRIFFFNRIIEPLINIHSSMQVFYEMCFLSRLFPANDIWVELLK